MSHDDSSGPRRTTAISPAISPPWPATASLTETTTAPATIGLFVPTRPSTSSARRMNRIEHRRQPCGPCPWRRDADLAAFGDADFAKLAAANGRPGAEAGVAAPMMSCHHDQPGTRHAMRLCAGWLAVVGYHHLGVRLHVLAGRLPEAVWTAPAGWPALYADLADLLAHRPCRPPDARRQPSEMS